MKAKRATPTHHDAPHVTRPDWRKEWERRKAEIVLALWSRYMREQGRMYLYFAPSSGSSWGTFAIIHEGEDAPAGYAPVHPEVVPPLDRRGIAVWLDKYSGNLPMLPTEGEYGNL